MAASSEEETTAATATAVAKQDCLVDLDGDPEDPNNLFTCLETEECCTVDLNPACCAQKDFEEEL